MTASAAASAGGRRPRRRRPARCPAPTHKRPRVRPRVIRGPPTSRPPCRIPALGGRPADPRAMLVSSTVGEIDRQVSVLANNRMRRSVLNVRRAGMVVTPPFSTRTRASAMSVRARDARPPRPCLRAAVDQEQNQVEVVDHEIEDDGDVCSARLDGAIRVASIKSGRRSRRRRRQGRREPLRCPTCRRLGARRRAAQSIGLRSVAAIVFRPARARRVRNARKASS